MRLQPRQRPGARSWARRQVLRVIPGRRCRGSSASSRAVRSRSPTHQRTSGLPSGPYPRELSYTAIRGPGAIWLSASCGPCASFARQSLAWWRLRDRAASGSRGPKGPRALPPTCRRPRSAS